VDKPDVRCIDGAAYALKLGPQFYVSPTELDKDQNTRTVRALSAGEAFVIPPGQFALLLTEEVVKMPPNAVGLFSIRSRIKWKGLVDVSGFHIDPGFWGQLTIAVFNAGPAPIHLRQGEPTFLMWLADLDSSASAKYAKHPTVPVTGIDVGVLNQAPGASESLQGVSAKIRSVDKELREKIHSVERQQGVISVTATLVLAIVIGLSVHWLYNTLKLPAPQVPPAVSLPAPAQAPVKLHPDP
jgi:dCTP deaminase